MTINRTHHDLKIDQQPFADLLSGGKTCEIRKDDRGFNVGDTVRLHEREDADYTGRTLDRAITHIQRGYGLPDGLCVLSYAWAAPEAEPVAYAQAWCAENEGTPAEFLSHSLLVKRSEVLGRKLTWRETIELIALTTDLPDADRDALLAMDDAPQHERIVAALTAPPATGVIVPRELLERAALHLSEGRLDGPAACAIRALLAQSQGVKP